MMGPICNAPRDMERSLFNINPIVRFLDSTEVARNKVGHYVSKGQWVADLACYSGYYTFLMAECVGPEGKVYAVDLDPSIIKLMEEKVSKSSFHNIELHCANAANLSFIEDHSIDFVLANGLL